MSQQKKKPILQQLDTNCGIPANCNSILKEKYTNEDVMYNDQLLLLKCLQRNKVPESIITIMMSILTNLMTLHYEKQKIKPSKPIPELFRFYCELFSRRIYRQFIEELEEYSKERLRINEHILQNEIYQIVKPDIEKYDLSDFDPSKIMSLLHQFIFINNFIYNLSSRGSSNYQQGNYSLIDYINQYIQKKVNPNQGDKFKSHRMLYQEITGYSYGCNCFCRTVLFGTLFTLLNKKAVFPVVFENPSYFTQSGTSSGQCGHFFFGIKMKAGESKKNYFYIENTFNPINLYQESRNLFPIIRSLNGNLSDENIKLYISALEYIKICRNKYPEIDTFAKEDSPLSMIILDEYFSRTPGAFTTWYTNSLGDSNSIFITYDTLFNSKILSLPSISFVEQTYRIFQELERFPNAGSIWDKYNPFFDLLMPKEYPRIIPMIQMIMVRPPVEYRHKNYVQILKHFPSNYGIHSDYYYKKYRKCITDLLNMLKRAGIPVDSIN